MKFQIGDRIIIKAGNGRGNKGTVFAVNDKYLHVNIDEKYYWIVLSNNCRKLIKKVKNKLNMSKVLDITKPVMTMGGLKAEFLMEVKNDNYPYIFKIIDFSGKNYVYQYNKTGRTNKFALSDLDLINIPEQKLLDLHLCGIYKLRNGELVLCVEYNSDSIYQFICVMIRVDRCLYALSFKSDGSYYNGSHPKDIIEKIGDIRDLNSDIRTYFEHAE